MRLPSVSNRSEKSRLSGRLVGGISPRTSQQSGLRARIGAFHRYLVAGLDGRFEDQLTVGERPLKALFVGLECLESMQGTRAWVDVFHVRTRRRVLRRWRGVR